MTVNLDLKATVRENLGSAESRRIRKSGNIPAVIYDGKDNIYISIPSKEFQVEYIKGNIFTTLINLDISGKSKKVIVNKLDTDPVSDRPSHLTLIKAESVVKVKSRVNFLNQDKSPGIKRGGFLHIVARKVELLCPVSAIPTEVVIDITPMLVGHKILSSDIQLPDNVSFVNKKPFNIASIIGRGSKTDDKTVAEGEEKVEDKKADDSK